MHAAHLVLLFRQVAPGIGVTACGLGRRLGWGWGKVISEENEPVVACIKRISVRHAST